MRWFTFEEGGARTMTTLDWLIILAYFAGLGCLTWWVISARTRTPRRTTFWPAAIWAGGSSAPRSSPPTSAPSTSSAWPVPARRTAWRWRTTSCTPGVCWCSPGCSCRSTALAGLHDAGVPRAALLGGVALRPLDRLAHHLHRLEDRGRHLRGRRGLRHAAARPAHHARQRHASTASGSGRCSSSS